MLAALLQHALATERASEGKEKAKREAAAAGARAYKHYLEEQMAKDAVDEEAITRARLEMEQRVWEEHDAARRRREEARAAFQDQVDDKNIWWQFPLSIDDVTYQATPHTKNTKQVRATNAEQVRRRALAQLEAAKLEAQQLEAWQAEQAKALEEERAREAARRDAARAHEAALRRQVEERRAQAALERQREYLQRKHMLKAEADHVKRLKAQAGRVRVYHPLSADRGPWAS